MKMTYTGDESEFENRKTYDVCVSNHYDGLKHSVDIFACDYDRGVLIQRNYPSFYAMCQEWAAYECGGRITVWED